MAWEIADEKTKSYIISEEREVKNSKIRSLCGIFIFLGIIVFIIILISSAAELSSYEMSVSNPYSIYDYRTDYRIVEQNRKAQDAETQRLVDARREELAAKYAAICIPIELGLAGVAFISVVVINNKYNAFCANPIYVKYGTCVGKTFVRGYRGINSRIELTVQPDDGRTVDIPVLPYIFNMVENGSPVILVSSNKSVSEKVFRSQKKL